MTDERNGVIDLVRHSGLGAIAAECHRLAVARGKYDGNDPAVQALKDLAGEVVELTVEYAMDMFAEDVGGSPGPSQHTRDEYGDVLANLLSWSVEVGIDPEASLRSAMERNRQRAEEGV